MFFLLFLTVMLMCFSLLVDRRKDTPTFIFCALWSLVFFLFLTNSFELTISDQGILILSIMIIGFCFGAFIYKGYNQRKKRYESFASISSEINSSLLRTTLFWCLCLFSVVVMTFDELVIIKQILTGSTFLNIIQNTGSVDTVSYDGIKGLLYVFIIYPVTYLVTPICAIECFSQEHIKKQYLIINIIIIFLSVMHHGARLMIIIALVTYAFCMYIYGRKYKISPRVKKLVIVLAIMAVISIISLSISRGIESIWSSFYMYFICEIPVMDNLLQSGVFRAHTYGFFSLNGFFYPLFTLLKILDINPPNSYELAQTIRYYLEESWIYISSYGHQINAFLPAGCYFYIDGGYVVEAIASLICGAFCQKKYELVRITRDKKIISSYLLIIVAIVLSFFRFYGVSYQFVLAYLYIKLLYKKVSM